MHDSIAAWMIAGGVRSETADRHLGHLVAIREVCATDAAVKPGFLDRIRARIGTSNTAPALECGGAGCC